jgi:hypothetical protein
MRNTILRLGILVAVLAVAAGNLWAQDEDDGDKRTVFEQLFPDPTGRNGYERIVRAGELSRELESGRPRTLALLPLAERREVLRDPRCVEALSLLRSGLAMSITLPRTEITAASPCPDYALLRSLSRLLIVEQSVRLADGDVRGAIGCAEDGVRVGRLVSDEWIMGGQVSRAIEAVSLRPLAANRAQWSARDCERILKMAKSALDAPDPAVASLEGERRYALGALHAIFADPAAAAEDARSPNDPITRALAGLARDPARRAAVEAKAAARINAGIDRALALLKDPSPAVYEEPDFSGSASPPKPQSTVSDDELAATMAAILMPTYESIAVRFAEARVSWQLLAIHAVVRRYQWEHDGALPETLAETELPATLLADPFRPGATLHYRRLDAEAHYELWSVGPRRKDGAPARVTLPWTPQPPKS